MRKGLKRIALFSLSTLLIGCSQSSDSFFERHKSIGYQGKGISRKEGDKEDFYETGTGVHDRNGREWTVTSSYDGYNWKGKATGPDGSEYRGEKNEGDATFTTERIK